MPKTSIINCIKKLIVLKLIWSKNTELWYCGRNYLPGIFIKKLETLYQFFPAVNFPNVFKKLAAQLEEE